MWTWVAMDADTKLVPTFHIGTRDLREANAPASRSLKPPERYGPGIDGACQYSTVRTC